MKGLVPLTGTGTLPSTLDLLSMETGMACNEIQHWDYEVLQATLARTIPSRSGEPGAGKCRVSGVPVDRVNGVGRNSGKPQAKCRARKQKWLNLNYVNIDNGSLERHWMNINPGWRIMRITLLI